ncbi:MAG: DUF3198 domain-containing protein [Candidatus Thermoplasmatota archaeon]|nr:DUF3198 domain-containing protein [Candidatus Thermoplasmatota archaeon]MBS3790089.1 DUF3198 domain-containing protein [Candidatus Thermoplasmatota archaeon]
MSWKDSFRKNEFLISIIAIVVGVFLLLVGLFGTFLSDHSLGIFTSINDLIGDWTWWFLVLGILLIFIFTIMIIIRIKRLREFDELYETESKSKFRKNIVRVEELAIKLGPEYEEKVIEKEEDLNLKR